MAHEASDGRGELGLVGSCQWAGHPAPGWWEQSQPKESVRKSYTGASEGRVLQQQLNTSPWTAAAAAAGVGVERRGGCPRGGVPQGLKEYGEVSPLLVVGSHRLSNSPLPPPKILKMATAIG